MTRYDGFLYPFRQGSLGVDLFFVISGFLITGLMMREQDTTGKLSLKRFYTHRAFRILPPLYVFLFVVGIRNWLGIDSVDKGSFFAAAFYYWNYRLGGVQILGHLWSLSLEEQFYLLWPIAVLLLSRKNCLKLAVVLVVLMPFSRVATYVLCPPLRGMTGMMLHTHIDTIMLGCILALCMDLYPALVQKFNRRWLFACSVVFLFGIEPKLFDRFRGWWHLPIGMTVDGLCALFIVLYAISHRDGLVGRILNNRLVRHVGVISYSLYLWQQMFCFNEPWSWPPLNLIPIFICAECSYFLVEKPARRLRDRLQARPRRLAVDPV